MQSASEWAMQQWGTVALGDTRLQRRAVALGSQMAAHPEWSLPNQMGNPSSLKAAYRFLNHRGVSRERLQAPHIAATLTSARTQALVLLVSDVTELDYSHHPETTGLGPIGNGCQQGLLVHSTLAIVPQARQVLGLACQQVVLRIPDRRTFTGSWARTPEGLVWRNAVEIIGPAPVGATWVHVSDRGSDIYEYLAACQMQGVACLVRAAKNRFLQIPADGEPPAKLLDFARSLPPALASAFQLHVPAHPPQPAREAELVLAWAPVEIPPPRYAPKVIKQLPPLGLHLVRVWEPAPPVGVKPLEWILLSSQPVTDLAGAHEKVDWYTARWFCEDYHQCLKTGCRVEASQLDDGRDLERLLGFVAPVAVRLLQLRQAARHTPELPATTLIEPLLVRVLAAHQKLDPARLTLALFWRTVARLGGYQDRRSDGPPGWRTLWRGWRHLSDLAEGARLLGASNTT
jgi:hypothetical protein